VVEAVAEGAKIKVAKKGFSSFWTKEKFEGRETLFLLPQTYMNRSGEAVQAAMAFYKIEPADLMVVHDDLDLNLGRLKVDFNAGPAGHRGVGSIVDLIGTKEFHRIRLGIGRPERKEEVESFVLSRFRDDEKDAKRVMVTAAQLELSDWIVKN
jgi:PTH1 family peptidyl-tRNA hydrolase